MHKKFAIQNRDTLDQPAYQKPTVSLLNPISAK